MSETGENIFNRAREVKKELEEKAAKKDKKEQDPIIIADGKTDLEKRTDEVSEKMKKDDKDVDDIIIA